MIAKIKDDIYFGNVVVCQLYDDADPQAVVDELILQKFVKEDETVESLKLDADHVGANTTEYIMNKHQYLLLFLFSRDLIAIVHECVHITNFLFKARNLKHDFDNDEAYAYYTAFWFDQIWGVVTEFDKQAALPKKRITKPKK